ncbi:glucoamylase family protein [Stenotrophomonas sp. YIM B06876]|uniref:glucoamylase family protein n=1 Tax=Stenotrophomonas sp. YIM B06876 TaxID=3060211 RepID=UPI0027393831|nr:glucoamylase family protein [Stenotrophomonas sp. YIM B06876]
MVRLPWTQLMSPLTSLTNDAMLDRLQHAAFDYFLLNVNPLNGLVADTSRPGSPASIAVVGFALSAYPVAVERGWIERRDAVQRSVAVLRFFHDSDQSGSATATGYKGFYYHFLDMHSGTRMWQSELSMIDTALLMGGVLAARMYFSAPGVEETELRALAEALYTRVDWCWSQGGDDTIRQGWKPESGYLHYGWEGYSEAILLYALAMGSPTHPITGSCYKGWTATYQWENLYGYDYLYAGPLFIHQFSHAWIDFRGIRDRFMRQVRSDYFHNSVNAVQIQREYARRNPYEFAGYNQHCWGLSACDGPSDAQPSRPQVPRRRFGYAARGVPYGPDDGTLSAPSMLASLPFAPDAVLDSIRYLLQHYPEVLTQGRLASSFNPSLAAASGPAWVSAGHYGLDQGIVLMMIENYRSGSIWQRMRDCPWLARGLQRAGFRGGWLPDSPDPAPERA